MLSGQTRQEVRAPFLIDMIEAKVKQAKERYQQAFNELRPMVLLRLAAIMNAQADKLFEVVEDMNNDQAEPKHPEACRPGPCPGMQVHDLLALAPRAKAHDQSVAKALRPVLDLPHGVERWLQDHTASYNETLVFLNAARASFNGQQATIMLTQAEFLALDRNDEAMRGLENMRDWLEHTNRADTD